MKDNHSLIFTALLLILIGILHAKIKKLPDPKEVKRISDTFKSVAKWNGKVAPNFKLPLSDGSTFHLADHIGKKTIIINFFATWCGPCRDEMPELQNFATKHKKDNLLLIGIDKEEKETLVKEFIKELDLKFPIAIDAEGDVSKKYGVSGLPTTVVISVAGTISSYETSMIHNADAVFGHLLKMDQVLLSEGQGISKERYISLSNLVDVSKGDGKVPLSHRAKVIVRIMRCPCGCTRKISSCTCQTATGIKNRLRTMDMKNMTDKEVIKKLNRQFCVGVRPSG